VPPIIAARLIVNTRIEVILVFSIFIEEIVIDIDIGIGIGAGIDIEVKARIDINIGLII
jgi:hypothetical protein